VAGPRRPRRPRSGAWSWPSGAGRGWRPPERCCARPGSGPATGPLTMPRPACGPPGKSSPAAPTPACSPCCWPGPNECWPAHRGRRRGLRPARCGHDRGQVADSGDLAGGVAGDEVRAGGRRGGNYVLARPAPRSAARGDMSGRRRSYCHGRIGLPPESEHRGRRPVGPRLSRPRVGQRATGAIRDRRRSE
jgi:hypothetical protein